MKTLVPWLCAIAFGAAAFYLYTDGSKKNAELAVLRPQAAEVQTLRAELEKAQAITAGQTTEIARLRSEGDDAIRLRNEVRQLRDEVQQLNKQLQTAQNASASAQAQAQQLKTANQQLQSAVKENTEAANRQGCINNLRALVAANQQWALEHKQPADARPSSQDLAPYLKDGRLPLCPGGGAYALGTVAGNPTCTHVGHVLPKE